jgi:hypothetical protein
MYGNQWPTVILTVPYCSIGNVFRLEDQTLLCYYKREPSYSLDIGHSIKCGSYQLMAHGTIIGNNLLHGCSKNVLNGIILDSQTVTNLSVGG